MTANRSKTFFASLAVLPLAALVIAGRGGGATASLAPNSTSDRAATVNVATTGLGKTLVDSKCRTLYLFEKDSGTRSACTGACAAAWPPLRTDGNPAADSGLSASRLGTITRPDGAAQVTYNGHPLYLYIKDRKLATRTARA